MFLAAAKYVFLLDVSKGLFGHPPAIDFAVERKHTGFASEFMITANPDKVNNTTQDKLRVANDQLQRNTSEWNKAKVTYSASQESHYWTNALHREPLIK